MQTKDVRIVVFGCQKIAIDIIDFIRSGHEAVGIDNDGYAVCPKLVGVVTHDEDRDKLFSDQTVKEYCDKNGILNFRFNNNVETENIKDLNPDIIFSIYYRKILPKSIIDIPKMGIINIHPADLPKNRGSNPTYWAVRRGNYCAFSTLYYIDEEMDTGDIIASKGEAIRMQTGFEVNKMMMNVGLELFRKHYKDIICGRNERISQCHDHATCNVAFTNNMRYIDWCQSASDIINQIRAHADPYAGSIARTKKGTEIIIHEAKTIDKPRDFFGPGSYESTDDGLVVQTHTRPILITRFIGKRLKKGRFITGVP